MSKPNRFGVAGLFLLLSLLSGSVLAQTNPPPEPAQKPDQSTPPPGAPPQPSPALPAKPVPQEPYVLEDGGFSFEPLYWLNKAQPDLHGGGAALAPGDFNYTGNAKAAIGAEIGVPAGRSNTLRFTYFRIQGNANSTLTNDAFIFSEQYSAGDYLAANTKIQAMKISWDYLSYTWRRSAGNIHLKTLYEVQYINVNTNFAAPFKAATTDSSGNVDDNTATGSKSLVLPTLGMAMGQAFGKNFRWDIRASGFGFPHKSVIWDAEATVAVRIGFVELVAGEKALHFKTSPGSDEYFSDTLSGVFGGVRFYWKGQR